jgi:hypothetical protein
MCALTGRHFFSQLEALVSQLLSIDEMLPSLPTIFNVTATIASVLRNNMLCLAGYASDVQDGLASPLSALCTWLIHSLGRQRHHHITT